MKFPITREALQAFDQKAEDAEQKEAIYQRMIECDVKLICDQVVKGISTLSREKRFIWKDTQQRYQYGVNTQQRAQQNVNRISIDEYLPLLIKKLQETFLGCDIISDPLKTYLIIDWS